ncbi:MAG: response regulator [Candidatus Protistobacter heckmanni]|nr:response regulator [Candidatus Protistobacter heckmanni]
MPARILIIEDNPANLELARYLLTARGHEVLGAVDGQKGVAAALVEHPDLIITDLQMPVLDGYGVLKQLREEPSMNGVPIIAVTAFSMPEDKTRVMTAGFSGYMSKPIVPEKFGQEIELFLPPGLRKQGDDG